MLDIVVMKNKHFAVCEVTIFNLILNDFASVVLILALTSRKIMKQQWNFGSYNKMCQLSLPFAGGLDAISYKGGSQTPLTKSLKF